MKKIAILASAVLSLASVAAHADKAIPPVDIVAKIEPAGEGG